VAPNLSILQNACRHNVQPAHDGLCDALQPRGDIKHAAEGSHPDGKPAEDRFFALTARSWDGSEGQGRVDMTSSASRGERLVFAHSGRLEST
jgi:hypothetical protein